MTEVGLSGRLLSLADMVTPGNRLVDVGCDHGYLSIYLVQTSRTPSAIAADVREGPLGRARAHIAENGLEDRIETRLSDGLAAVSPGEGDALVISGMGGPLILRILEEYPDCRDSFREMILGPQSDLANFRPLLFGMLEGWELTGEDMVEEDGKFYPVIRMSRGDGAGHGAAMTPEEEAFGPVLLKRRHPVLLKYLLRERRIRQDILRKLEENDNPRAAGRKQEIEKEQQLISAALRRYESV